MKYYLSIPAKCPVCGSDTKVEVSNSGVENLICTNPQCSGKLINIVDHYCSKKGLDIKGLSKATLEKLVDLEWITEIKDLYNLRKYKDEWIQQPGFGVKSVEKILQAIDDSRNCQLSSFISALGIPLIGSTVAKDLANYFCTWSKFYNAVTSNFKFSGIHNFGYEMEKSLLTFDWAKVDELIKEANINIQDVKQEQENENAATLTDKVIVITGKLHSFKNRDELMAAIEAHGGKVSNSITGKTSVLINNDSASTTAKNKAAIEKGIPIMTEEEFINKFFDF